jgi:voltage-dependent anion channel protein 2
LGYCCWFELFNDFDTSTNSTSTSHHNRNPPLRLPPVNVKLKARFTLLTRPRSKTGVTLTETWTTASVINTKLELVDVIAQGVKAEFLGSASTKQGLGLKGQKLSLYFTQGAFHARGFFDYNPSSGNVNATLDGVFGHEGFVVGGEAGYDVQKAALTRYSAALGYGTPIYSAALTSTSNLSVFAASYYHKVNPSVEAGVKAAYDVKSSSTVGLEIASKYRIDPTSFAKVC